MSSAAVSTETKDSIEKEFNELFKEFSSPTRFNHLAIKWLSFITTIISKHGLKSTDATQSYRLAEGYPIWNDNEKIIPAFGEKLGKEISLFLRPESINEFVKGLHYFETLLAIYKENAKENVRFTKITKNPMAELFSYANYSVNKDVLIFLLNVSEKDFEWLKEAIEAGGEKDMIIEKNTLTAQLKELFLIKKEQTLLSSINEIKDYRYAFPEKEIMYGWILEKHKKITTTELEEIVNLTRSTTLALELKKRPAKELSFTAFLSTISV